MKQKEIMIFAHRGARSYAPENTLESFEKAIAMGVDGIELDVHLSKDGHLIVHHDDDLIRCTNIQEHFFPNIASSQFYVSDYDLKQIKSLDAGGWFVREFRKAQQSQTSSESYLNLLTGDELSRYVSTADLTHYASGRIKIPTLEEVLQHVKDTNTILNIEIKTIPRMYKGIAKEVMGLVQHFAMLSRTIISSFDHQQLLKIRKQNKKIKTAVLSSDRLAMPQQYLAVLQANAYNPGCYNGFDSLGFHSVDGRLATKAIRDCRRAGYGVNVWTCNEERHMKKLLKAGVSGIITDIPNRAVKVRSSG
ncbi:MAG: glycerophosphodiester phosphodiesterase family protein [Spirochaetota bacterium]